MEDYETCLAEETCEVSDDVLNKAYGPDVLEQIREDEAAEAEVEDAVSDEDADAPGPPAARAARFHAHFGAGRLGLGLVVPAIAARAPARESSRSG